MFAHSNLAKQTPRSISLLLALLLTCQFASTTFGQFEGFQLDPALSNLNSGPSDPELKFASRIRMQPGQAVGLLEITATMDPAWHVYSLTQPPGGPLKSQIKLDPSDQYRLLGSFSPDHPPKQHYVDVFDMNAEEFAGQVTWSAPIEVTGNVSDLKITGFVEGQVCADGGGCIPFDEDEAKFEATVDGSLSADETASLTGVQLPRTHSPIRSWLSKANATPGETVNLFVAFNPANKWHVYAYEAKAESQFQKPTLIHASLPDGWKSGSAKSSAPIISKESPLGDEPTRYYEGPATIALPITIPAEATAGAYPLTGHVAFQTCDEGTCDRPTAVAWKSQINVVAEDAASPGASALGSVSFEKSPARYNDVAKMLVSASASTPSEKVAQTELPQTESSPAQTAVEPTDSVVADSTNHSPEPEVASPSSTGGIAGIEFEAQNSIAETPLYRILGLAFIGGFILNFMPCVLPVIGLKVLSFVDQAGSDRVRVFNLNLWYAIGMISVFWILAVLAAAPLLGLSEKGFGWGEQFNSQGFNISLICLIFAMALSFLGVWEIPIPGFATGSKATELSEQKGLSGAFFKGVITTVLATPCSAPGLGTAYGFAVSSNSVAMPFLIFTVMGLGMAIPYILIGIFPSLVRFLPKPGAWMDTFKQLMGFVLLGTVVLLLYNVDFENLVPTMAMLFGLWFACWWIGRVPLTAPADQRWRAWGVAAVICMLATAFCFGRHWPVGEITISGLKGSSERKLARLIDRQVAQRVAGTGATTKPVAHNENELPWETYSPELLDELIGDQHTVLVDFTADW